MKQVLRYLVYSNLWVALAVGSMAWFSMVSLPSVQIGYLLLVMFSTAFTYNYMRFVQIRGFDLRSPFRFKAWTAEHRKEVFLLMLVFGSLTGLVFIEIFSIQLLLLMIFPALVSFLYPLSFKRPFSSFTSLRDVPGLKMFLIAITWSYVTALVPAALYSAVGVDTVFECIMRTLLIVALVIPFDIRDVDYDDAQMKTIPQVLGAGQAQQLSMFFITLYQMWVLVRLFIFNDPYFYTIALIAGLEAGYWLVRYSHRRHGELYFSFWIEGVPIFCGVLLVIGGFIM